MKYATTFVLFSTLFVSYVAAAGNIQLQPTPGILIPATALRFARSAYGGAPASTYSSPAPAPTATYSAPTPAAAPAKSSYGSSSATIKAPPCPKNYMFSCQPSLTPVPCAAPAQSYSTPASSYSTPTGSPQGSYSHSYPLYALPQYGGYPQYAAVPIVRELY